MLGLIIIIRYFIWMVTLRNKGNSHTILMLVEISFYLISPDAPRISYVYSDNTDGIREILRKRWTELSCFRILPDFPIWRLVFKNRTIWFNLANTFRASAMCKQRCDEKFCDTCDVWWLISCGSRRAKRKSRLKKVHEVFLFILVPNTLHFRLYRLVTRRSHRYCTIPQIFIKSFIFSICLIVNEMGDKIYILFIS